MVVSIYNGLQMVCQSVWLNWAKMPFRIVVPCNRRLWRFHALCERLVINASSGASPLPLLCLSTSCPPIPLCCSRRCSLIARSYGRWRYHPLYPKFRRVVLAVVVPWRMYQSRRLSGSLIAGLLNTARLYEGSIFQKISQQFIERRILVVLCWWRWRFDLLPYNF